MARKRQETLVLFPEVLSITHKFTDAQFGTLIRAAFAYRFTRETYSGDDVAIDVAFQTIANQIDRLTEYSEINSQNAKKGERKQMETECSEMQGNHPPIQSNPILSVPIQESKADKPPTRPRFSPPSAEEVAAYCQEKGYPVDAGRFVDYYASVGWKRGKSPIKDWKAAVRTWARKDAPKPATPVPENCGYTTAPLEDPWEVAMRERRQGNV